METTTDLMAKRDDERLASITSGAASPLDFLRFVGEDAQLTERRTLDLLPAAMMAMRTIQAVEDEDDEEMRAFAWSRAYQIYRRARDRGETDYAQAQPDRPERALYL